MTDIFLSYRRQDSSSATGRLADRLEEHFGPGRVFRDHQSINPGEDFTEAIRRAVSTSTVMLAIIGPDWLTAQGSDGKRRLDQPTDFVRQEIETALQAHVPVIPVLVEGAQMPARETLPKSIGELWRINAMELSESRWHFDTDTLMRTLQTRYVIESERPAMGDMPGQTPLFGSGARFALEPAGAGHAPDAHDRQAADRPGDRPRARTRVPARQPGGGQPAGAAGLPAAGGLVVDRRTGAALRRRHAGAGARRPGADDAAVGGADAGLARWPAGASNCSRSR